MKMFENKNVEPSHVVFLGSHSRISSIDNLIVQWSGKSVTNWCVYDHGVMTKRTRLRVYNYGGHKMVVKCIFYC